jgi:hypothetical protein
VSGGFIWPCVWIYCCKFVLFILLNVSTMPAESLFVLFYNFIYTFTHRDEFLCSIWCPYLIILILISFNLVRLQLSAPLNETVSMIQLWYSWSHQFCQLTADKEREDNIKSSAMNTKLKRGTNYQRKCQKITCIIAFWDWWRAFGENVI